MIRIINEHLDEETVVQWLNERDWTPLTGALLVCGVKPPYGSDEIPLAEWEILSNGSERIATALRLLAYWKSHRMGLGRVQPPVFLAWCRFKNVDIREFLVCVERFAPELYKRIDPSRLGDHEAIRRTYRLYGGLFADDEWGYRSPQAAPGAHWLPDPVPTTRIGSDTSSRASSFSMQPDVQLPPAIATKHIVRLFSELGKRKLSEEDERKWNRTFSSPPEGLKSARLGQIKKGVEATWHPVMVATWLHQVRKRQLAQLDRVFQSESLAAWRSLWETEANRLRNQPGFVG